MTEISPVTLAIVMALCAIGGGVALLGVLAVTRESARPPENEPEGEKPDERHPPRQHQ